MRKDLYAAGKEPVKDRKRDPYAFFTMSLRNRKFEISCLIKAKHCYNKRFKILRKS